MSLNPNIGRLIVLASIALAVLYAGCGKDESARRTRLSMDVELYPPLELIRTSDGDLIALAAEGPERSWTLYRSTNDGRAWERWIAVPVPDAENARVDLAVGGTHLGLLAIQPERLWAGILPVDAKDESYWAQHELTTDLPIQSAAIALAGPDVHVIYLTGIPEDSVRTMFQVRSPDTGTSWLEPKPLTSGVIDGVTLETQPGGSRVVDIGYMRESLYRWRGVTGADTTDEFRIRLQVAPGSRNRLARLGRNVFASGESKRHQAVGAFSDNAGRNWGRAMALARDSGSRRDPDIDAGFGVYWVTYVAHDSVLVVRTTAEPQRPRNWSSGIWIARGETVGYPYIVAMPDSTAGVLHAAPEGKVFFTRVRKP